MRSVVLTTFLSFLLLSCQSTNQVAKLDKNNPVSLSLRINRILENFDSRAKIGMQIVSLKTNESIYHHHADQLFTPASVLKVYTAAAALKYLGPSFRFETKILVDGLNKNKIKNLYIYASGDPSFSHHDLSKIALVLKQRGIEEIKDNIIIDDNLFDDTQWGNGWMWNDMINGYSAPISALNVNQNKVAIFAWPGLNIDDPVFVTVEPYTDYLNLQVSAKTGEKNADTRTWFSLKAPSTNQAKNQNTLRGINENQTIYVTGNLPKHKAYQYETFSIENPHAYAGYLLKEQLKKNQIRFHGKITDGTVSKEATLIDTITSKALGESLIDFVKFSSNQPMEVLLKTIGLTSDEAPGTFEKGNKAVKKFLKEDVKMNTKGLINADGSGLSRYSLTSPNQLVELLQYMWNNFRYGPEFIASMAIAGEDGTLNGIWKQSPLKGLVRAKDGSMSNICTLAGYLNEKTQGPFVFAFMVNSTTMSRASCHQMFNDILKEVLIP